MFRWEKEALNAPTIARYSLGLISLDTLAKKLGVTTLEAMQLLQSAGYKSSYSYEDYQEGQKLLDGFLDYWPPEGERKSSTKTKASKKTRK